MDLILEPDPALDFKRDMSRSLAVLFKHTALGRERAAGRGRAEFLRQIARAEGLSDLPAEIVDELRAMRRDLEAESRLGTAEVPQDKLDLVAATITYEPMRLELPSFRR